MATTVATNALLERKGEKFALGIAEGFKDCLATDFGPQLPRWMQSTDGCWWDVLPRYLRRCSTTPTGQPHIPAAIEKGEEHLFSRPFSLENDELVPHEIERPT